MDSWVAKRNREKMIKKDEQKKKCKYEKIHPEINIDPKGRNVPLNHFFRPKYNDEMKPKRIFSIEAKLKVKVIARTEKRLRLKIEEFLEGKVEEYLLEPLKIEDSGVTEI